MVSGIVAFLAFLPLEPVWSAYTYPYLWGPVLADAAGHDVDGIHAGYSPVSTLTYGVLMVCALLLVHRALRRGGIPIDRGFVMAAIPFVALGAVLRVLEDATYFHTPLAYLFISPLMYVTVASGFLVLLALSHLIGMAPLRRRDPLVILLLVALAALSLAVMSGSRWRSPAYVAFTVVALAMAYVMTPAPRDRTGILFFSGVALLVLTSTPLAWRIAGGPWDGGAAVDPHPWVVPATLLIASAVTLAVYVSWRAIRRAGWVRVPPTAMPLFFAHILDGTATAIGIDLVGAWEKHPLPRALIGISGTGLVMIPLKVLVVGLFVYLVVGPYKEEVARDPGLYRLVYLAVLVLGLAPGLRNMLRLALGV